jgi:hypothetical protein
MAKNSIRDYDATSGNNTDVQSVDISEGCAASGINNALREIMADLKDVSTGAVNLETPGADQLNVDNLRLDGNTISSTDTNGDITLDPNGTGDTIIASGNLGVNTASPSAPVHVVDGDPAIRLEDSDAPSGTYNLINGNGVSGRMSFSADDGNTASGSHMRFLVDGSEAARINEDRSVLVGKIAANFATPGAEIAADGRGVFTRDSNTPLFVNRETDNGKILELRRDNQYRGALGLETDGFFIDGETSHAGLTFGANQIIPRKNGAIIDDTIDVGSGTYRFDDIRATNGTIQTSDQNEKQQIASLTTAEITAAKAISKLFKTYKWNKAVTNKGDAARTHAGVIAQELQTAMTDAGLDAANYAFWCSDTWWEADGETYETADDAPEGATQRTRLGVRYPELLAFIGAATEQRLADLETRVTALEDA